MPALTDSSPTKPEWHRMLNWQLPHKETLNYPSDHFRKADGGEKQGVSMTVLFYDNTSDLSSST